MMMMTMICVAHLIAAIQAAAPPAPVASPATQVPAPAPSAPSPEAVARAKEIYQPSAAHDWLARLSGAWDQDVEYSSGPNRTVKASGRLVNRIVLGGRFIVSEGTAKAPDGGLETASILVFGFDGRTRQYTVIVLDTFGTYYVTASGAAGSDENELLLHGETKERSGLKKFDVILTWLNDDTYRTKIVFHFPGREPVVAVSATNRRTRSNSGL